MEQFKEDMRKSIRDWENELSVVHKCQHEVLHPLQRQGFDYIAETLRGFIREETLSCLT